MGKIAVSIGILLLLVLVLGFALLCLRVGLSVQVQNEGAAIQIQVGFLHKTIRFGKGGKSAKKPTKKPDKPEVEQEKSDKFNLPDFDLGDLICEVLSLLEDMKDRLRIDVLCIRLLLATGDAAKTGMCLGGLSALAGMVYPFFEENFQIHEFHVQIDGDFEGNITQYDLRFGCSARPIRMIGAAVRHGRKLYHIVKQKQSMEAK